MHFSDLDGKRVVVTGASSGLGESFARLFAKHGAYVVVAARRRQSLDRLVADIAAEGGVAEAATLDVSDLGSIDAFASGAGSATDVLVNNAGISAQAPAIEMLVDDWDTVIETNLRGSFLLSKAVARS